MPGLHTQERIWALDDQGARHAITVTRPRLKDAPHLQGLPRFTWGAGRSLNIVDNEAGVLECNLTRQRLKIEDWNG
jgi:hypothetical protein